MTRAANRTKNTDATGDPAGSSADNRSSRPARKTAATQTGNEHENNMTGNTPVRAVRAYHQSIPTTKGDASKKRRPFDCLRTTTSIIYQERQPERSTKTSCSRTNHGNEAKTATDTAGPGQQQPAPQILHRGSLPTPSAHLLEAISLLRTFKKYPDNMKNLPEAGGLPSPTKATKGQSPGTHRSAMRGTNSRSRSPSEKQCSKQISYRLELFITITHI